MAADYPRNNIGPRDDVPEADRAEQQRDAIPRPDDDAVAPDEAADSAIAGDLEVDPLQADEADQIEQAIVVPDEEDYDRR